MAGFIRRFGFFPGVDVITQIEGVVIVDLPPPGTISGVGTGTVAIVGEFTDATQGVDMSTGGIVTGNPKPLEVFSGQDMLDQGGPFDETIGKFGAEGGNAFASLRNKRFSRLILVPIDNITPAAGGIGGIRIWRDLPTNQSATIPQPIVPVPGAVVLAGREFRNAGNRVRTAKRIAFTDFIAYTSGTDGSVTPAALPAATQVFVSAGGLFTTVVRNDGTVGVQVGDILVVGVIGAAGAQGTDSGTFRVTAVNSATDLVIERMDGSNFTTLNWVAGTTIAWRLHVASTADTSGVLGNNHLALSGAGGYQVIARPLDATIAIGLALTPAVVPAAGTANSYDPLSGLTAKAHPSQAMTYDANVHAPNAANNATLDARYQAAVDACLDDNYPARDINILYASRKSTVIRAKLKSHVGVASDRGLTRTAVIAPSLTTLTLATVLGDADPGVGANRSDRIDYSWPGALHSVPEAVGFSLGTSDGKTTTDGLLDDSFDGWLTSILSNLAPERNPGEATPTTATVLAPVLGFQRGVPKLGMNEYIQLRQKGIAALRLDRTVGPIVQSGITTSLVSGQKNIFRRRMADFIQDSIARRIVQFAKQPLTQQLKDGAVAEVNAFLNELLSPNNPAAQRIDAYQVDDKSGNTPTLTAQGIFVIIVRVRLTPTADFIVLQTEIGEGVTIQEAA